jgi:hypothetical protein
MRILLLVVSDWWYVVGDKWLVVSSEVDLEFESYEL